MFLAALALLFACKPEDKTVQLEGIALSEHEITLVKGEDKVLSVKFTPETATDKTLSWTCSATSVATVTDGKVVAVAPGKAEIVVISGQLSDKCQVTVVSPAASVALEPEELTLIIGETASLKATVLPEDTTDKLEWSSDKEDVVKVKDGVLMAVAVGEATITAKAGDKTATCLVSVEGKMEAVDLGLSVKWAAWNLGAEKRSDYGDYYAWGETEPKETYTWATYKFGNSQAGPFSKYNDEDNKTVLDPEDDAAHVKLGGKWRMPTIDEYKELLSSCKRELGSMVGGVKGYYFTSKTNGNSIFLPAGGQKEDENGYTNPQYGYYWASSRNEEPSGAWYLFFSGSNFYFLNDDRYGGRLVRAVREN